MKRHISDSTPPPTVVIDGYTDLSRIGAGGFSVVYRAHEIALNRMVAVKVLNAGLTTDNERRLFERECKALGQLGHPDIVRVYRSVYTNDDRPCIVMELYDGNFRDVVAGGGALPAPTLLDVGVRMAVALHVAHTKGVLHRDVKPHNIFRSRYGDPALGDFGISTVIGERTHSGPGGLSIAYAAPELLEEDTIGPAADVYALAATLHHLASGAPPFSAGDLRHTVRKILTEEPPPVNRPDLPTGFDRALRAGLAKDPSQRPATALAFAEMLREVQARSGQPQTAVKLELDDSRDRSTGADPERSRPPNIVAPTPPPAPPTNLAGDQIGDTVVRRQPKASPPDGDAADPVSRRRVFIAGGAAVAAIAIVAVSVIAARSSETPPNSVAVSAATAPSESFVSVIAPPEAAVTAGAAPGSFSVGISPVEGAVRYQVTLATRDQRVIDVTPDQLPLAIDAPGVASLCVTVQAIGASGRISPPSRAFCS